MLFLKERGGRYPFIPTKNAQMLVMVLLPTARSLCSQRRKSYSLLFLIKDNVVVLNERISENHLIIGILLHRGMTQIQHFDRRFSGQIRSWDRKRFALNLECQD